MKKISKILLIVTFTICVNATAQNRMVEDSQMKFKISVPLNYQTNQYWDGSDKIHAFVSRDNNVAVSIRSFELPANVSVDQVVTAFGQNVLKGANQLVIQPHNLNGAIGKMAGYRWRYNNITVVVGDIYTCRYSYEYNGSMFSYTAVDGPVTFYLVGFVAGTGVAAELEKIHNRVHCSFKKVNPGNITGEQQPTQKVGLQHSSASLTQAGINEVPMEMLFDIKPLTIKIGTAVNSSDEISSATNSFPSNTEKIHLVFDYQGDTKDKNFIVKWVSKTHNTLIAEDLYHPKTGGSKRVHSYMENVSESWPTGDYSAQVWYLGDKVSEADFSITASQSPQLKIGLKGGEIKQIVLDNTNIGYDFASGKVRTDHSPDPDFLNRPWCTTLPGICGNWARTGKSRMEDVTSAPISGYISDGLDYIECAEAPLKEVLVFKLKDGTYGKMMIIKDEFSKNNNVCLHKITCFVQYPAF